MSKENLIVGILIVVLLLVGGGVYLYKNPSTKNSGSAVTDTNSNKLDFVVYTQKSISLGQFLAGQRGMTLYTFSDDEKLKSNCNGDCIKNWPPYFYDGRDLKSFSDVLSKRMNVIKRSDGSYQYAYGTQPLYYYALDSKPGDANGNGKNNGKWNIIPVR